MKYEYLIVWKRERSAEQRTIRQTYKGALSHIEHLKWADRMAKVPIDEYGGGNPYFRVSPLERWFIRRREVGAWEDFEA